MRRVTTGIDGLDRIVGGGFPSMTSILLSGCPGTGKTLFSLNFLIDGAAKGEKCCYITLSEKKDELIRACKGIDELNRIDEFIDKNLIIEELTLGETINVDYFTKMFSLYPKIDRLVIDSINKLLIYADNNRIYRLRMNKLLRFLKEKINCSLLLCETRQKEIDTGNGEAFDCDGVIHLSFLEFEEKPVRTLEIHKLRYSSFDPLLPRELIIDEKGLRLSDMVIV